MKVESYGAVKLALTVRPYSSTLVTWSTDILETVA